MKTQMNQTHIKIPKQNKKLDQLEEKLNQLAQQIENLESLQFKQEDISELKLVSKKQERIQALRAKLNSDLPEKRKVKIAEKLSTLKEQHQDVSEIQKSEKVQQFIQKLSDETITNKRKVCSSEKSFLIKSTLSNVSP
eukprot:gene10729-3349_t